MSEAVAEFPVYAEPKIRKLVHVEDLTVVFSGFRALNIALFEIPQGELRVVIGPNGAGKTTLCDVITGKTRATTGRIFFGNEEITHVSEMDIAARGIGRKFQTPTVFNSLTVLENMKLALPRARGVWRNLYQRESSEEMDKIHSILDRVRLTACAGTTAKHLSHGQRQWLEISMLIISSPKLLLVDEPAAGLTDEETALTAELLCELRKDHTLMVIEHDMDFVRQLNAPVTVLSEGQILAEGTLDEVQQNENVIEAYLGR